MHVVTLVTPDGAYGGPVRVAVNQLKALADLGHEVTLVAGYQGYDQPPTEVDGVPARLFPVIRVVPRTGFAGIAAPRMIRYLWRSLSGYDVIHVHLARDLITLPASRVAVRKACPLVVQTHGMIDPSERLLSKPLDVAWTRRTLREAGAVLYLTDSERSGLTSVCGDSSNFIHLPNGVPVSEDLRDRRTTSETVDVLFLGRLHPSKRPLIFAEAARRLTEEFPEATFSLVGPDEGEGESIRQFISHHRLEGVLRWEGALNPSQTQARLAQAGIYVNPRIEETFAMATLEAAAAGLPLVATDSSGISPEIAQYEAGRVIGNEAEDLVIALRELLSDPRSTMEIGRNAKRMATELFNIQSIAGRLDYVYRQVIP